MLPAPAGMSLAGTTARAIVIGLPKHPGAGGFGPFNPRYPQDVTFGEGLVSLWLSVEQGEAVGNMLAVSSTPGFSIQPYKAQNACQGGVF